MFIYYVYAYLRSSANTPYYIGKGKGTRAFIDHGRISTPKDTSKIVFLETRLSNVGACALERRYIRWYGRKNIDPNGILHNVCEGGEGNSSPRSTVQKQKMQEGAKKYWTKNRRQRRSDKMKEELDSNSLMSWNKSPDKTHPRGMLGKHHTEITKDALRSKRQGKRYEEIYGEEKAQVLKEQIRKRTTGVSKEYLKGKTYEEIHGEERAKELKILRSRKGRKVTSFTKPAKIECKHCGKMYDPGNFKRHQNRLATMAVVDDSYNFSDMPSH